MDLGPAKFALKHKQTDGEGEESRRRKQHRTVEALVQGDGKEGNVLGRLVTVLARLALTNAAELRDIAGIVFICLLMPIDGAVAVAMKTAGQTYHETVQALKAKNDEKGLEELGPPYVHIFMAMVLGINQDQCEQWTKDIILPFWMTHIKDKGATEVQTAVLHCKSRPTKTKENKTGMVKLTLALPAKHSEVQDALVAELCRRNGVIKRGPAPRGPLERAAQQLLDEFEGNKKGKDKAKGSGM